MSFKLTVGFFWFLGAAPAEIVSLLSPSWPEVVSCVCILLGCLFLDSIFSVVFSSVARFWAALILPVVTASKLFRSIGSSRLYSSSHHVSFQLSNLPCSFSSVAFWILFRLVVFFSVASSRPHLIFSELVRQRAALILLGRILSVGSCLSSCVTFRALSIHLSSSQMCPLLFLFGRTVQGRIRCVVKVLSSEIVLSMWEGGGDSVRCGGTAAEAEAGAG